MEENNNVIKQLADVEELESKLAPGTPIITIPPDFHQ